MAAVKDGDTIKVHYTGRFDDGTVFDSSENGEPLQFTVGAGNVIKGFDQGVVGMDINETRTLNIPAADAYGPYHDEMVFEFDRNKTPEGFDPEIGRQVQMHRADGEAVVVTVIGKTESAFIMDCNHALAGKDLIFEIKLMEIV